LSDLPSEKPFANLLDGAVEVSLSTTKREQAMSGEKTLDTKSLQLVKIRSVPLHSRAISIDHAKNAPIEDGVTGEHPGAFLIPIPRQKAKGIAAMTAHMNRSEHGASSGEYVAILNCFIDHTGPEAEFHRVKPLIPSDTQAGSLLIPSLKDVA